MSTKKAHTPAQDRTLGNLRAAVERCPVPLRTAILRALQADCTDTELGRAVRLGALKNTAVAK